MNGRFQDLILRIQLKVEAANTGKEKLLLVCEQPRGFTRLSWRMD